MAETENTTVQHSAPARDAMPPWALEIHLDFPRRDAPAYLIPKDMPRSEAAALLDVKIQQLVAMLELTHGPAAEGLREHGSLTREYFMWACSMLAREIHCLWCAHDQMLTREAIAAQQAATAGAPGEPQPA